ncbi:MAG: FAD-binding oxidoreductase [candidate division Zixibacteria bacterium]|nr:FAD-binding oxidoreductase [candidate division Zixibacteria bacterium]
MREKADAVVIGGGIIGMAAAFYLARAQYGKIVLLERDSLTGTGSTSKAAGGIRAQFSNRVNIKMSMLSEKLFCQFKEDTGQEALFDQVGYMFLLSRPEDVESFYLSVELQRSLGLKVDILKADDIARLAPHVRLDDIHSATFCADDGLADPHEFLSGYEKAARNLGVEIELETEVTGLTRTGDRITEVITNRGNIACGMVVNATGAFGSQIGQMIGVDLPVQPIRRQCVTTGELDFVRPDFPMVVDVASGLYFHKESKGLLLGWADPDVKPSTDISIDPDYTDNILERALDRIPQLETAEVANQWAGLYEVTPDHRAIIGYEPKVEGLFHVLGFSGHGLMQAPAAGLICSQILTDQKPEIDISDLSPARFSKGKIQKETNVI